MPAGHGYRLVIPHFRKVKQEVIRVSLLAGLDTSIRFQVAHMCTHLFVVVLMNTHTHT